MKKIIILNQKDNVATALTTIEIGDMIENPITNTEIEIKDKIYFEHKFALCDIKKGEKVFKYGVPIGIAYKDIQLGEHIHLHNLKSLMLDEIEGEDLDKEWSNRI